MKNKGTSCKCLENQILIEFSETQGAVSIQGPMGNMTECFIREQVINILISAMNRIREDDKIKDIKV